MKIECPDAVQYGRDNHLSGAFTEDNLEEFKNLLNHESSIYDKMDKQVRDNCYVNFINVFILIS